MGESRAEQIERIKVQVDQYIGLHDKLNLGSRPDAFVDAGAQKRPRRDGKAPTNDAAHRWMADPGNRDAARKIEPAIRELRGARATYGGISLYYVVCVAGYGGAWGVDFAELRRWQRKRSRDAREHHAAYEAALDMLARMIVANCERIGISGEIHVNPKGEDGYSDEHAESKDAAAKKDAGQTKQAQKDARDEAIRERYAELKASVPWSEPEIRRHVARELAPPGKGLLNRETVNAALRQAGSVA